MNGSTFFIHQVLSHLGCWGIVKHNIMKIKYLLVLSLVVTMFSSSCTTNPVELYEKGERYYNSGQTDNAMRCYHKSAEKGYSPAQFRLGEYYLEIEQEEKAVVFLKPAAEQGNVKAQAYLALCYYLGKGVDKNDTEAARWFKAAAENGDVVAQEYLAKCYVRGLGVEQSYSNGAKWFRKAAEQGSASAQYYVGLCYEEGDGVEQSNEEAKKWYQKSANQGYNKAIDALESIEWEEMQVPSWLLGRWVSDNTKIDPTTYEIITTYLDVTTYGYKITYSRSGGGGYHLDADWNGMRTKGDNCYNSKGEIVFSLIRSNYHGVTDKLKYSDEIWSRY